MPDAGVAGVEGVHPPVRGREGGNCTSTILKQTALQLESQSQAERAQRMVMGKKISKKLIVGLGTCLFVFFLINSRGSVNLT